MTTSCLLPSARTAPRLALFTPSAALPTGQANPRLQSGAHTSIAEGVMKRFLMVLARSLAAWPA
jgi:hypothetical protein